MTKNVQRPPSVQKLARVDRKVGTRKAHTAAAASTVRQAKKTDPVKALQPKPKVSSKKHIHEAERNAEEAALDRAREEAMQDDLEDAQHLQHVAGHVHIEAEDEELLEVEREEHAHDTGATGHDAVKRSQGDSGGHNDGFGGRERGREAYERYLRGNVDADAARMDELKRRGAKDDFNPQRAPIEVEALGAQRASAHVVRLYETWTLAGVPREDAVSRAAAFIAGFGSLQNVRRVLAELESKPIRDVYPLEVLMKLLDERPQLLPGVRPGRVIANVDELSSSGRKLLAGVPFLLHVPADVRIKAFALLGGARPGYELQPDKDEGRYQLLVDTPGQWTMSILAAPLQDLGRIKRETSEAILEIFTVEVFAMGKKGEPLSHAEYAAARAMEDNEDEDDIEDDIEDEPIGSAPKLAVQVQRALEHIRRTESGPGDATTYSWEATFYRPGDAVASEPILHIVVHAAGPFDVAWQRARERIESKQKEYEPGRSTVTADDFTAALRRARVR